MTEVVIKEYYSLAFLVKATIVVSSGGLIFGYDIGVISGTLSTISKEFGLNTFEDGIVVSILYAGSILGCVVGGPICDHFGRWKTIHFQNLIFIISALVAGFSPNFFWLCVGRFLVGIASAISGLADVPYLTEISPPSYRGILSGQYEVLVSLGILVSFVLGLSFNYVEHGWRYAFILPALLALIQSAGMFLIPESPKWLISKKKFKKARNALVRIYGENRFKLLPYDFTKTNDFPLDLSEDDIVPKDVIEYNHAILDYINHPDDPRPHPHHLLDYFGFHFHESTNPQHNPLDHSQHILHDSPSTSSNNNNNTNNSSNNNNNSTLVSSTSLKDIPSSLKYTNTMPIEPSIESSKGSNKSSKSNKSTKSNESTSNKNKPSKEGYQAVPTTPNSSDSSSPIPSTASNSLKQERPSFFQTPILAIKYYWDSILHIFHHENHLMDEYAYSIYIIFWIQILSQFTGANVIRNYAPIIFEDGGVSSSMSLIFNVILGIIKVIFTTISVMLIEQSGRKNFFLFGVFLVTIGMGILMVASICSSNGNIDNVAVFVLGCALIYAGFGFSYGPMPWVLASEMFPTQIRSRIVSWSLIASNLSQFLTNFVFLPMTSAIKTSGSFGIFFGLNICTLFFLFYYMVETKERSPIEILHDLHLRYSMVSTQGFGKIFWQFILETVYFRPNQTTGGSTEGYLQLKQTTDTPNFNNSINNSNQESSSLSPSSMSSKSNHISLTEITTNNNSNKYSNNLSLTQPTNSNPYDDSITP